MTDATQPGGSPAGGNDPWAPPEHRTSLDKGASTGPGQHIPGTPPAAGGPAGTQPPSVHDQPTVVSMPAAGPTPPGATPPGGVPPYGAPGAPLPPPPVAPTGPGAPMPPGVPMGHGGPAGYGYPGYPQGYGWSGMPLPPQNGAGTAAMVLGILACCMFCAYGVVSVVLGILAIVFGIKGRKRVAEGLADNHSQAQAGLITGIIGLILGLAVVVVVIVSIMVAVNSDTSYEDDEYGYGAQRPVVTAPALG